jgi:hypothetical protein
MSANSTRQEMLLTKDEKAQPITAVWRNGGFGASYDSFVVGSSAVLRLIFCAKIRHYAKPQTVSTHFRTTANDKDSIHIDNFRFDFGTFGFRTKPADNKSNSSRFQ